MPDLPEEVPDDDLTDDLEEDVAEAEHLAPAARWVALYGRDLNEAERAAVRAVISAAVLNRDGARVTARALQEATSRVTVSEFPMDLIEAIRTRGTRGVPRTTIEAIASRALQCDFELVASTEIHTELAFARRRELIEQCAAVGLRDPLVYTFAAPRGCRECRRIWGDLRKPNAYPLSLIMGRDTAGGNYGLPRKQWGPVTGPVHPGCTCPGYSLYNEKLVASINNAADQILATYRR